MPTAPYGPKTPPGDDVVITACGHHQRYQCEDCGFCTICDFCECEED